MSNNNDNLESYQIEIIVYNKVGYLSDRRFTSKLQQGIQADEIFKNIIERHSDDFGTLFRELIPFFETSSFEVKDYENLSKDKLIKFIKTLEEECNHFKKISTELKQENLKLGEEWANKERDRLKTKILELEIKTQNIDREKNQLSRTLQNEQWTTKQLRSQISQTQITQKKYDDLVNQWNNLVRDYEYLKGSLSQLSNLEAENQKLQKYKKNSAERLSSLEKELDEARQKLGLATSRLHEKTVKPGIAGGGSHSDKLKHDFDNLKRGLFHETSGKILSNWREQENKLTFRSEEFSRIKSILSKCVFIDGMLYFTADQQEMNTNIESIMNELLSVEGLILNQSISQNIQEKITNVLLGAKSFDETDQAFMDYMETTTAKILEDLQEIRDYPLPEEIVQAIKELVEEGLKLVHEVVKDASPGEFYLPEMDAEFDEVQHNTRDEPEGNIKLTICAGYRTEGTILTKADVITYIPDTANNDTENDSGETEDSGASEQSSNEINPTDSEQKENQNNDGQQDESYNNQENITQDSSDSIYDEGSLDENSNDSEEANSGKEIYLYSFIGTVKPKKGVELYSQPYDNHEQYYTTLSIKSDQEIEFDAWCRSDAMEFKHQQDHRWYRCKKININGQQCWVPASYIQGEPPNSSPFLPK